MKTIALAGLALLAAGSTAFAADMPGGSQPLALDVSVPVMAVPQGNGDYVAPRRLSLYELTATGWQPVRAAVVPRSGVPGTDGRFTNANADAVMLEKDGLVAYCVVAQVGGTFNECHILGPGK